MIRYNRDIGSGYRVFWLLKSNEEKERREKKNKKGWAAVR